MSSSRPLPADPTDSEVQKQDLRKLARGSSLNLAGSFVAAALNLAMPVLITRSLVKDDAGVFFQATALFTILINVGTLGADTGLLRTLPRAIALSKPHDITASFRVSLGPPVIVSTLLAAALALLADPIGRWSTGDNGSAATQLSHALLILAAALPVAATYNISLSASRGLGSVKALVMVEKLGRGLLQVAAIVLAFALGGGVLSVVLAWSIPYVLAFLALIVWTTQLVRAALRRIDSSPEAAQEAVSRSLASDFWRFSAPRAVSRVFSVALQRFDIVIVGALRGPSEAAVYAAATRFPILGLMFVQAIQQVMAPRISEFLARGDSDRALAMYRTTTCWLTLVSWPIYLLSVSYAALLLDVFGDGYDRASTVVVILCLSMLVATACGPVDSVLLMGGRSMLSLLNTGIALVATIALDLILIPQIGITGAAVGWTVGILANNLLPLWQVDRYLRMHPFGRATLAAMALTALTFGLVPLLVRLVSGADLVSLLVAGSLATALFLVGAVRSRRLLELDELFAALRRRPKPSRTRPR